MRRFFAISHLDGALLFVNGVIDTDNVITLKSPTGGI